MHLLNALQRRLGNHPGMACIGLDGQPMLHWPWWRSQAAPTLLQTIGSLLT